MRKKIAIYNRINARILAVLLILFSIAAIIVSIINQNNIRHLYEENFTERVLLTNALMATIVDSEDVNYFVELMKNQNDEFKRRQVQFYYERLELWALQEQGADEAAQQKLLESLEAFHHDMAALKTDKYWEIVNELKHLKEVSNSTYLYIMSDTGLKTHEGETLYSFIIDADDDAVYGGIDNDGLGMCDVSQDSIIIVYNTKKQMEWVNYYDGGYGELYYAYAPICNENGDVIAVFGTDLDLKKMNESIAASTSLFNTTFLVIFVCIICILFIFLHRSIVTPLGSLTDTAHALAGGNIYAQTSKLALIQRSEIGMLANAVNDMSAVYQDMIKNAGKLFADASIGKLTMRSDASKFKGDIQNFIKQINGTLDATTLYLNSIPESIFIISKEFEMHFHNASFHARFGDMPALDFLSRLFLPDGLSDAQNEKAFIKEQVANLLAQENNNTAVYINGCCFSVFLKEIVLREIAESSILVVAADITDLMNEKINAQAAAEAKSSFLSRMSHEMRTPMNAIIGMTKIAEDSDDIAKLKHCLTTIHTSSVHLLGIINDVLDMSKIEAGKFELENAPINLEKTLMKVCNILTDNMEKKRQKFNVILSKDMELNYIGDELRLSQVITNLLSNAVKFTPEAGKITLTVEKARQLEDSNTLLFSVADTGIGMTDEQIARLFNAFEQADGSVSRKYGGTGLGLAISKNIVEKMGGRIWVESELGIGSIFRFEICLTRASHQDAILFDGIRPDNMKLLIVENDDDVRSRFLSIIDSFGMSADAAKEADEALALTDAAYGTNCAYDIIFWDYDMPNANGFDDILRLNGKIDKNTVIIITTFVEWHQIKNEALQNNITRYITKPLFPSSILDAINDIVGIKLKTLDITASIAEQVPDLYGVHILLAEDVEINREIFLALLEETRISIDIAENGLAAVSMFKENPDQYDLIVMDIQMPEMDGYQATRAIRAMDIQKAKTIPIIAMTANAFKEDIEKCLAVGMNDHLAKPIDAELVIKKITDYVK